MKDEEQKVEIPVQLVKKEDYQLQFDTYVKLKYTNAKVQADERSSIEAKVLAARRTMLESDFTAIEKLLDDHL